MASYEEESGPPTQTDGKGEEPMSNYECGICDSTFQSFDLRNKHTQESHSQIRTPRCKKCGHIFKTQANLHAHFSIHSSDWNEKPFKCLTCPSGFNMKYQLSKHYRLIHNMKMPEVVQLNPGAGGLAYEKPYQCGICSEKFSAIELLERHVKNGHHSENSDDTVAVEPKPRGPQRFECGICYKSFPTHNSRHQHNVIMHKTEENIYPCKYCRVEFRSFRNLYSHLLTHTGIEDGPFKCHRKNCGGGFHSENQMKNHIKLVHRPIVVPNPKPKVKKNRNYRPFNYRKKMSMSKKKMKLAWKDLGITAAGNNLNGAMTTSTTTTETTTFTVENRRKQSFNIKIEEEESESILNPISSFVHVVVQDPNSTIPYQGQGFGQIEEVDTNVREQKYMVDPFTGVYGGDSDILMNNSAGPSLPVPVSLYFETDDPNIEIKPEIGELFMGGNLSED